MNDGCGCRVPIVELAARVGYPLIAHTGNAHQPLEAFLDDVRENGGVDLRPHVTTDWLGRESLPTEVASEALLAMISFREQLAAKELAYRLYLQQRQAEVRAEREALVRRHRESEKRHAVARSEAARREAEKRGAEKLAEEQRKAAERKGNPVSFDKFDPARDLKPQV